MNEKNKVEYIVSLIEKLEPKEIREIFMTLWRNADGLSEGLTADDCIEIFASALKGSSDFTYDLLKDTCHDYGVGTMTETFALLPRETYDKLFPECLKGEIPPETRLDTEALVNLLRLQNVAEVETVLPDVAQKTRVLLSLHGKYIHIIENPCKETMPFIDDFSKKYAAAHWQIGTVFNR
ncbi:hypothetical protein [Neisseria dentiae]|uniref:hypothetical protein n=1 Tax=Neisseria dentiae TaxID=194197 RepID=UPI00211C93D2|nr:hypothetical protein [Neisseria dentiae]MCQ9326925.1 hypothetical protein [Neisseria dentiae]